MIVEVSCTRGTFHASLRTSALEPDAAYRKLWGNTKEAAKRDAARVRTAQKVVRAWKTRLYKGAVLRLHYHDGFATVTTWDAIAALFGLTENRYEAAEAITA